ncbi:sigma-70 family RNA polymerase sigma factor [Salisediminibacterium selenitireducens]|uniref:RNA polymerase, sigma 28 subunit, FliA/WhiG subfamily n=1 Tax=Bacillus selenitireducens (strain ATCC 700615 / DSM 15326 / MLS10) TaxID=439292 RepID=D6Y009_BACIE|nr:sigma-70 family RNA polymerase sigma factor [Salisediminibacterium selenitireducens]ADI00511.1 putative RNA polymerase, sigma 28 subunit, FliA/WhiG subfamily [[Bacillus] selenitireducens MLS10]
MTRFIQVGQTKVPVSEKMYKEYHQMDRRARYLERDIKVGRIDVDGEHYHFKPAKEDSFERLTDNGSAFTSGSDVEATVIDNLTRALLQEAMNELNEQDRQFIEDYFFEEKTTRQIGKEQNTSHVAVVKRQKRVLEKIKKSFFKKGVTKMPFPLAKK